MARFQTALIMIVLTDLLFIFGGLISDNGVTCLIKMGYNLSFDTCDFFSLIQLVITALGGIAGIVISFYAPSKIEMAVSAGLTTYIIGNVLPDLWKIGNVIRNNLGIEITILIILPIAILSLIAVYDWWRSPSSS